VENDIHLNAGPTQGQYLHEEYKDKKEKHKEVTKESILSRYGGEEYLEKAPKEIVDGQTENYVEYSQTGQIIKGKERAKARSKYPEDVYINNHTSVWGSWYDASSSTWGYACCHSSVHMSYCAGEAGKEAAYASTAQALLASSSNSRSDPSTQEAVAEPRSRIEQNYSKKRVGEGDVSLDKERLAEALSEERKRKGWGGDEEDRFSKKKKKGVEISSHDVTEEELEAYRMNRRNTDDPMANYVDTEDPY